MLPSAPLWQVPTITHTHYALAYVSYLLSGPRSFTRTVLSISGVSVRSLAARPHWCDEADLERRPAARAVVVVEGITDLVEACSLSWTTPASTASCNPTGHGRHQQRRWLRQ